MRSISVRIPGTQIVIHDITQRQGIVVGIKGAGKTTFLYSIIWGLWNVWYFRLPWVGIDPVGTLADMVYRSFSKVNIVRVRFGTEKVFNIPPPVVHNLSSLTLREQQGFADKIGVYIQPNSILLVDELHRFIPQRKREGFAENFMQFTLVARNRNIGIVGATQRLSLVDKNYINNCGYMIIFKQSGLADLKYLLDLLKMRYDSSRAKKIVKSVSHLSQGEFIYIEL